MEFRTQVTIDKPSFLIEPCEEILFVGSCFADAIGQRFREEAFPVIANPSPHPSALGHHYSCRIVNGSSCRFPDSRY